MEDKVSKVVEIAKKIEATTGRTINNEELRDLCSRVSDEHSFNMESLDEIADDQPRRVENVNIPIAYVAGSNGNDYASV